MNSHPLPATASTPNNNKRYTRHFSFHLEQSKDSHDDASPSTQTAAWRNLRGKGGAGGGGGSAGGSASGILPSPLRLYFSRRHVVSSAKEHHTFLLNPGVNEKFVGIYSPVALVWGVVFLVVPAAYVYILLVLLREWCRTFPKVFDFLQQYLPWLAGIVTALHSVSRWVEVWCAIEAVFYLCLKLHIHWLQTRDPLEASLSAAPLMELHDRQWLWQRMMACEADDPIAFLRGWFFEQPLESISKYDVRDFTAWSMFEGRHQEHLTNAELRQLEQFVHELEWRISLHMYGEQQTNIDDEDDDDDDDELDRDPVDAVQLNLDVSESGDGDDVNHSIFTKVPKKRESPKLDCSHKHNSEILFARRINECAHQMPTLLHRLWFCRTVDSRRVERFQ